MPVCVGSPCNRPNKKQQHEREQILEHGIWITVPNGTKQAANPRRNAKEGSRARIRLRFSKWHLEGVRYSGNCSCIAETPSSKRKTLERPRIWFREGLRVILERQ